MKKPTYYMGGSTPYVDTRFTIKGGLVHYQINELEAWRKQATPITPTEFKVQGARLVTTTAIKVDGDRVEHFGDIYLDLDLKDGLKESARVLLAVFDYLQKLGVHGADIHAWASGSKGWHVRIPSACFMGALAEFSRNFSTACKALARHLIAHLNSLGFAQTGIDLAIYKAGRGQQIRVENMPRANSFYKVCVDSVDLGRVAETSNEEQARQVYQELCSSPRPDESWRPNPAGAIELANLFRDLANKAIASEEKTRAVLKALEASEGLGNPIVGRKLLRNILAALAFRGPNGERAFTAGWLDWTKVALMLHWVGANFDVMAEAEAAFIEYSKSISGFKCEADCSQRFHHIDEDQAKKHLTPATLFGIVKPWGFLEVDPTGKNLYAFEENALSVLNNWLALKDQDAMRKRLREPVFVAAFRACQIAGYKPTLGADVEDRARDLGLIRELKQALKELDTDLGTAVESDETTAEKTNKWASDKLRLAIDQFGEPVGIVDGQAFALNDGFSVVSALAKSWVSDPATAGKPFPQKSMLDLVPTWIAKASVSGETVTFAERWVRAHGVTYIDYHWCVVAVTKAGWEVIDKLPKDMYFRKTLFCAPMPQLPRRRGDELLGSALLAAINKLAEVINLAPASVPVLAACLTYSVVHETGAPGVAFVGPSGSGKSFAASTARKLIHPSRRSAESLPKSLNDMLAIVDQGLMTLFDNISGISLEQSDTWARFISEPSINFVSKRKLFTDGQVCGVRCGRIIWTTGIVRADDQADLRSRMIGLKVQALESSVQTEAELTARFDQYAPELMAALLDLCVGAWSLVGTYTPGHPIRAKISRLANFDMWLGACFEVLGLTWQAGLDAVAAERTEEAVQALQGHKYLCWLTKLKGEFVGTVSELSQELSNIAQASTGSRPFNWPSNKALITELGKQQTAIIKAGFVYEEIAQSSSKKAKKLRIVSPFGVFD